MGKDEEIVKEEIEEEIVKEFTYYVHCLPDKVPHGSLGWYVFTGKDKGLQEAPWMTSRKELPRGLRNAIFYANTVWKSKIFFLGGEIRSGYNFNFLNTVFAFDTKSKSWEEFKPMLCPRSSHTAITTKVSKKMYALGTSPRGEVRGENWGECFDFTTGEWNYLPPPPQNIDIISHAVDENNHRILFWVFPFDIGIPVLDCVSDQWLPTIDMSHPICHAPGWSKRVAVVDNVLIWHYAGEIYTCDLLNQQQQLVPQGPFESLIDCDFQSTRDNYPANDKCFPFGTFLLPSGEGSLVVFWQRQQALGKEQLHCRNCSYKINRIGGGGEGEGELNTTTVEIHADSPQVFEYGMPGTIDDVLAVSMQESLEDELAPLQKDERTSPPLWYLTAEEFDTLPYMKGGLTLNTLNAAIDDMAAFVKANAQLISDSKKQGRRRIASEEALKGKHFFLKMDMTGPTLKLNNYGRLIMWALRNLGRVTEAKIWDNDVVILAEPQ